MIRLQARTPDAFGAPSIVNDDGPCTVCGELPSSSPAFAGLHRYGPTTHDYRAPSILIQTDRDYPGIAATFGWDIRTVPGRRGLRNVRCSHDGTDGTIGCEGCGTTAAEFIDAARDWMDDHDGATADDPGYFTAD